MNELAEALYMLCMASIGRVAPNGSVYDYWNHTFGYVPNVKNTPGVAAMAEAIEKESLLKGHARAALKEKNRGAYGISSRFAQRAYLFVAEIFAKKGWHEFGSPAENRYDCRFSRWHTVCYGVPHEYQDGPGPSFYILYKLWE